ncbi:MAG TPA: hypothetical protein VMG62_00500 [Solirubrobacteraceae bacterium]|nr:hypothetical protein [Solirubrobacteraceae bacterium]
MTSATQHLRRARRHEAGALALAIVVLHALAFGLLALAMRAHAGAAPAGGVGLGLGITAYTLGCRHAFDADHIAAIDNSTRKLMADGRRPLSTGFFFSLGHSTVVLALALGLALGAHALQVQVQAGGSTLHELGDLIGAGVSGCFLYAIAAANLASLVGIMRALRRMRARGYAEGATPELGPSAGGPMSRLLGRFAARISSPRQMYPVGVLFGLGFDTATEVALLLITAGAAAGGLPVYAVLCLPLLFAAGMSLLDTLDGAFMRFAYGWALTTPANRLYYNLTTTGLSVAVALLIGTAELASIASEHLGLTGWPGSWLASIDLSTLGYAIVALFAMTWIVALAMGRLRGKPAPADPQRA